MFETHIFEIIRSNMKNNKPKSPFKTARKEARKAIQLRLVKELTAITGQLKIGTDNKVIDIEKESKKLAKKISKGIKADKAAKSAVSATPKTVTKPKAVAEPIKAADVKKEKTTAKPATTKPAAEPVKTVKAAAKKA